MCISVQFAGTICHPFDAEHGVITVPAGLSHALTLRAVMVVLAELHIHQDTTTPTCWCGAPIDLTGRIPAQRKGELTSGAQSR